MANLKTKPRQVASRTRGEATMTQGTVLPSIQNANYPIHNGKLFRAGLLLLLLMTIALCAAVWNTIQDLAIPVQEVPVVLVGVVGILVVRLYGKVDELEAMHHAVACAGQGTEPPYKFIPGQIAPETRDEIWSCWDKNGTGVQEIESIGSRYGMPANVVQYLLEQYDTRLREQIASLYCDNPHNEYMAYNGIDKTMVEEDVRRLKSGLPLFPVAGVWLCSSCHKRPCECNSARPNEERLN
jgi:hypothetical protein